mmetsp:Transcript_147487/g.473796  ORF Transcript_147487/g.473796 Transcript_147487/m.473796 type:complete len:232 (+) Transcript_147487:32-727(+)
MPKHPATSHADVVSVAPRILVYSLHHRLELLHGATLVELRDAVLEHLLDSLLPEHRLRDLRGEVVVQLPRIRARSLCSPPDIHVDVHRGEVHVYDFCLQRAKQLHACRLHQLGVESTGCLQGPGLQRTILLRQQLQLIYSSLVSGAAVALRKEVICDLAESVPAIICLPGATARLQAESLQCDLVQAGNGQHGLWALLALLVHGIGSYSDYSEALLEAKHASKPERIVLAE